MQSAEVVLSMLAQKAAQNSEFVFDRLYRNLFNPSFFMLAYRNLSAREGNMTVADSFNTAQVEKLIDALKRETYKPGPARKATNPRKDDVFRATDRASFSDALVQEVVRLLLQAIYEPWFTDSSHGFRPNRSCHTALVQIKTTCKGADWVIEGDIKDFFETISHNKLRTILSRRISDGRFLNLIDQFLNTGDGESQRAHGNSQGSIIGSILMNIYLHDFDVLMGKLCVQYTRYADDFVIIVTGDKALAERIGEEGRIFLQQELQLTLDLAKSRPTNLTDRNVCFLGYEIAKTRETSAISTNFPGARKREPIQLLVPGDVIHKKLEPFVANGKAVHHNARVNLPLLDLLTQYNAEIRGLYDYYCLATDVSTKLGKFRYYHYYSLLKTVARKEQCSIASVLSTYGVSVKLRQRAGTRKIFGVMYQTGEEVTETLTYFNEPLVKKDWPAEGKAGVVLETASVLKVASNAVGACASQERLESRIH
jgi:group II intron reverse transcriptase/maturase